MVKIGDLVIDRRDNQSLGLVKNVEWYDSFEYCTSFYLVRVDWLTGKNNERTQILSMEFLEKLEDK